MNLRDDQIAAITHDLAQKFVEQYRPDELIYFPLLWETYVQHGTKSNSQKAKGLLAQLGLPFEKGLNLISPLTIITIKAVLMEAGSFGRSPGLDQFRKAVTATAEAFGADPSLTAQMAKRIAPDLFALFQNLAEAEPSKRDLRVDKSEQAPFGHVYVDWLFNNEYKTAQLIPKPDQALLIQNNVPQCTVAVDETKGKIQVWIGGTLKVESMADKVPAMLWLAMTHVGTKIHFQKIRTLFDLKEDRDVYLGRNQLKRYFEYFWNENLMKESPRTQKYSVEETGWCFYWFRLDKNPRFSELVYQYKKAGRLMGLDLSYYDQATQAHQILPGRPCENQEE